jgi:hypothetical protein
MNDFSRGFILPRRMIYGDIEERNSIRDCFPLRRRPAIRPGLKSKTVPVYAYVREKRSKRAR